MLFNTLGVMLDCTRNAVMTVEALKEYMLLLKKMGYNHVQLYTEDTYEVDGEELFGYNRGRYSQKELKELDDFAYSIGIELVPCIQTLAHLTATLRWKKSRTPWGPSNLMYLPVYSTEGKVGSKIWRSQVHLPILSSMGRSSSVSSSLTFDRREVITRTYSGSSLTFVPSCSMSS